MSFETILNVSLIDFCLSAELKVSQSSSVFTYISGSGPATFDLQAAKNAIQIDTDHQSHCQPITFEFDQAGGTDFDTSWANIDASNSNVVVDVELLTTVTEFSIIVSGKIRGDTSKAQASHQVKIIVELPQTEERLD